MAEYKGDEPVVLSVTASDIPADYERNDTRPLWLCGECWRMNYEFERECMRCGEER